jgi:DNA-directed RNA polymerase subunit beta'
MDFDGDTVAVHVAATQKAVEEARELIPSKNLFGAGNKQSTIPKLGNEYVLGLYKLTKEKKTTSKRYKLPSEAIRDFKAGKIKHNDIVSVEKLGRTTAGKCLAMEPVPRELRNYQISLSKKNIGKMLKTVANKAGQDTFVKVITAWKHLGRKYVYLTGSSFLVSDLRLLTKERNQLYRAADAKARQVESRKDLSKKEKTKKINAIYAAVDAKIIGQVGNLPTNNTGVDNNISNMVQAGSRGNPNQVKQLVGHLGQMLNHRQQIMREPVRGNVGEGLSSYDFWQHTYAQRKGMIDKSQSVSGPGQLSKEMTNSGTRQVISVQDCKTSNGVNETVDRHIVDRLSIRS